MDVRLLPDKKNLKRDFMENNLETGVAKQKSIWRKKTGRPSRNE